MLPASAPTHSAIVVPVPEAEPAVGRYRARLDRAAAEGMPAHVTVLYPFVAPPEITEVTVRLLASAIASVGAFDCTFRRTEWFGERVLWLAPEPDAPFRALTQAVTAAFPGYLPYEGAFSGLTPHLTVGEKPPGAGASAAGGSAGGDAGGLPAAEAGVLRALPVSARISRAWLMTGGATRGGWHQIATLPLGTPG